MKTGTSQKHPSWTIVCRLKYVTDDIKRCVSEHPSIWSFCRHIEFCFKWGVNYDKIIVLSTSLNKYSRTIYRINYKILKALHRQSEIPEPINFCPTKFAVCTKNSLNLVKMYETAVYLRIFGSHRTKVSKIDA